MTRIDKFDDLIKYEIPFLSCLRVAATVLSDLSSLIHDRGHDTHKYGNYCTNKISYWSGPWLQIFLLVQSKKMFKRQKCSEPIVSRGLPIIVFLAVCTKHTMLDMKYLKYLQWQSWPHHTALTSHNSRYSNSTIQTPHLTGLMLTANCRHVTQLTLISCSYRQIKVN